jgi:hypothetical protein
MTILIQTISKDFHAAAVLAALGDIDIPTVLSIGTDVPVKQSYSYQIDGDSESLSISRGDFSYNVDESIGVIWSRRAQLCSLTNIHPDDKEFVDREISLFLEGFWSKTGPRTKWINPWKSRVLANTKVFQLAAARAAGFVVPQTLISNSPHEIRRFAEKLGEGNVVFKTISPTSWELPSGGVAVTPAVLFPVNLLENAASLQSCPGIYQELIRRKNEYRVTVMGDRVYAVRIDIPFRERDIDWRQHYDVMALVEIDLPESVDDSCRKILGHLNLRFGCIDIIEDQEGNWNFLEINEMGQFLWIEEINPDARYLEYFIRFLLLEYGSSQKFSGKLSEVRKTSIFRDFMGCPQ